MKDADFIVAAWKNEAYSINHIISVYAQGKKPNYPTIDSISFNVFNVSDNQLIVESVHRAVERTNKDKIFFALPMQVALAFLDLNGRNDAGNFEPMEKTVNRAAIKAIKVTLWDKFPYSVILVPGEGPDDAIALDPVGKIRCDLAVQQYKRGLAPFIMVSGGKVHPFKTKYCEAEEMKKYLISVIGLPEEAIIMEPHARHTTTNLRNASRLIYKYNIPSDKPAVVITDMEQSRYISKMDGRCITELGYVPYRLGNRLSGTIMEFYPVWTANQINVTEPLDP